jgi:DNA polymerase
MSAAEFVPDRPTLPRLREAVQECRGCDLWRGPTQAVFSEGPAKARIMLVGEMPGDREDREGRPFVGPAGRELDRALETAGIDRGDVYVTNAVKHFKFEERGKRRIHQTPRKGEVDACFPWLDTEIKLVRPEAIVTRGATAAKALLGSGFRLTQHRGELLDSELAPIVAATIHPSAIVRQRDAEARQAERDALAAELQAVASAVAARG